MLLYDPAVSDVDPYLLDAAIAAARLALDNDHLAEQVHVVRDKLVRSVYDERRRLERDLHDGAQQSLVLVNIAIARARREAGQDSPAATKYLDEAASLLRDWRATHRGKPTRGRNHGDSGIAASGPASDLGNRAKALTGLRYGCTSHAMIRFVNLRDLPPAARTVAIAVRSAVDAARAVDAEALRAAATELAGLDAAQTSTVMGAVTRMLLEEQHPDGLDGDDIRDVLEACVRSAIAWLPETDPHTLLVILAGALGIHPEEHEGVPRPSGHAMSLNAPLLIAHLLTSTGRQLDPYLATAFAEIARAQTMEAP